MGLREKGYLIALYYIRKDFTQGKILLAQIFQDFFK